MTTACAVIAAALAGSACYSMQAVTLNDLGGEKTSRVWVTRADQSVVVLHDAQLFRGNLAGFIDGKYQELPPADVGQMRVRKLAAGRTLALIGAGAVAATLAAVALAGGSDYFDNCIGNDDCEDALRVAY
jgi:hypothetical protein